MTRATVSQEVAASRACFSYAGCSYFLQTSAWSACGDDCVQRRTTTCKRSDNTTAAEAFCSLLPMPSIKRSCC